jgi:hypothetical protein
MYISAIYGAYSYAAGVSKKNRMKKLAIIEKDIGLK